jgi:hypothetical protein
MPINEIASHRPRQGDDAGRHGIGGRLLSVGAHDAHAATSRSLQVAKDHQPRPGCPPLPTRASWARSLKFPCLMRRKVLINGSKQLVQVIQIAKITSHKNRKTFGPKLKFPAPASRELVSKNSCVGKSSCMGWESCCRGPQTPCCRDRPRGPCPRWRAAPHQAPEPGRDGLDSGRPDAKKISQK